MTLRGDSFEFASFDDSAAIQLQLGMVDATTQCDEMAADDIADTQGEPESAERGVALVVETFAQTDEAMSPWRPPPGQDASTMVELHEAVEIMVQTDIADVADVGIMADIPTSDVAEKMDTEIQTDSAENLSESVSKEDVATMVDTASTVETMVQTDEADEALRTANVVDVATKVEPVMTMVAETQTEKGEEASGAISMVDVATTMDDVQMPASEEHVPSDGLPAASTADAGTEMMPPAQVDSASQTDLVEPPQLRPESADDDKNTDMELDSEPAAEPDASSVEESDAASRQEDPEPHLEGPRGLTELQELARQIDDIFKRGNLYLQPKEDGVALTLTPQSQKGLNMKPRIFHQNISHTETPDAQFRDEAAAHSVLSDVVELGEICQGILEVSYDQKFCTAEGWDRERHRSWLDILAGNRTGLVERTLRAAIESPHLDVSQSRVNLEQSLNNVLEWEFHLTGKNVDPVILAWRQNFGGADRYQKKLTPPARRPSKQSQHAPAPLPPSSAGGVASTVRAANRLQKARAAAMQRIADRSQRR